MGLKFVHEAKANLQRSEVGTGPIAEGEFVVEQSDGTVRPFDPANDSLPHGIVVHYAEGDSIAEHDEDYFANYDDLWTYAAGENLYWNPLSDVDRIMPKAIAEQSNPSSSEPDFGEGKVIGVVALGSGETRVVPEGYTYDGVTYGESGAGDFVSVGRMEDYPQNLRIQTAYDQRIPIRLDADLF